MGSTEYATIAVPSDKIASGYNELDKTITSPWGYDVVHSVPIKSGPQNK